MASAAALQCKIMPENPSQTISQFLAQLESGNVTPILFKQFLLALNVLPLDLPLLQGIGKFLAGEKNTIVAKKMESRYRRIAFVQQTLEKINFSKAKSETRFEDFIFAQSDFSIYEKIDAETFQLLFVEGLDDFPDDFFTKTLRQKKSEIQKIISARYKLLDGFYVSDGNPLIIPFMRSIHTSLDFAPFPHQDQFRNEMETLLEFLHQNVNLPEIFFQYFVQEEDDLFCNMLKLFDKINVVHNDNMTSRFFIAEENHQTALFAVFNPLGKSFTKLMSVSNVPFQMND
jgi:hypothetical protein